MSLRILSQPAQIADDQITQAMIADNAVGNAQMADNAIAQAELADNAVGNAEMRDDAVGSAEIAADTLTLTGTLAARPAATAVKAGVVYVATDGVTARSNGTAWDIIEGAFG